MNRISALIAVGVAGCAVSASAAFTTLTIPNFDLDIRTFSDGATYAPLFPASNQTLAGVPFSFQADANGLNAYGGTAPLIIPVNVNGVTTVYTLINTAWGTAGSIAGNLTFEGSGGLSHTVDLVVGSNVRDHFFGTFENNTSDPGTIDNVFGSPDPGRSHLDMQAFTLPASFTAATLEEIIFQPLGGNPGGRAFLVGATVAALNGTSVPDGGATLLLLGLASTFLFLRRKS